MKCPTDGATLVMSERSGIEIDYCPDCRGVWLDRGELDKIIDRAAADVPAPPRPAPVAEPYRDDRRRPEQTPYRRKKKEHWLSELFD
jgi:Zn-finger nucleic acid-binding protein